MEVIYRAFDGKEFFDEYSCEEHEQQIKAKEHNGEITGFDYYGLPLSIIDNLAEFVSNAYFIGVKTESAVKFIQEVYKGEEFAQVCTKVGAYKYTYKTGEWENIDIIIKKLKSNIAELEQTKEKLMKN